MNREQVIELLLGALEQESCGIRVYEAGLECVQNDDLKQEFSKYLEQTRNHERILLEVCGKLQIPPDAMTPARAVVNLLGESLVQAIRQAKANGKPEAAELVACACVTLAETKDHLNWELIGQVARNGKGDGVEVLQGAYDEVEDQEDEHLYHSRGWTREQWIQCLGMKAVLPPPEEKKDVRTAIDAAKAAQARKAH